MNIILVTDAYPPEIRSSSHLMYEMAHELNSLNHNITVLTSWPRYNLNKSMQKSSFKELTFEDGIRVISVKTLPHHKVSFITRGISQLIMPWQFLACLKKHSTEIFHAAIVYSPPLPLYRVGASLRKKGAHFILNVQDLFPQNAIDLGILRNSILISIFRTIERTAYKHADQILLHSENNQNYIKKSHPKISAKCNVLHNWVDTEIYNIPHSNNYRIKYGLKNKFIIGFAGVMGPSQQLNLILDAAKELQHIKDLVFLFVGDGGELNNLKRISHDQGLSNVHFQQFVDRDEYPELLKNFDVGLVCLSPKNHTPVVPGKLLTYMADGIPVLAVLHRESDGNSIVQNAICGIAVPSDNPEEIKDAIERLLNSRDKLLNWGRNGTNYVSANFEKRSVMLKLTSDLKRHTNQL